VPRALARAKRSVPSSKNHLAIKGDTRAPRVAVGVSRKKIACWKREEGGMKRSRVRRLSAVALAALAFGSSLHGQPHKASDLAGSNWQLVRFDAADGTRLVPADASNYTLAFQADGKVAVRIDCNRGQGSWKSAAPGQLQFGPLALTRAACPPAAINERLARDWPHIRSYVHDVKEGRRFLSLLADGGTYVFERRADAAATEPEPQVASIGPVQYDCISGEASTAEGLTATFYRTVPGLVLVRRGTETRPAFQARSASGARYVGQDLLFWDAHGEAQVNWSGLELKCKPRDAK
jgi:para-nitrobenzyl esterase